MMDFFARKIVGGRIDKRMTTDLVSKALMSTYTLKQPIRRLMFHSDRGCQYTRKSYRGLRASMGDVEGCWDNAVMERFLVV